MNSDWDDSWHEDCEEGYAFNLDHYSKPAHKSLKQKSIFIDVLDKEFNLTPEELREILREHYPEKLI